MNKWTWAGLRSLGKSFVNLFVTSKKETTNCPISEFLIKSDSKNKKTNRKGAHKESDPKGPLMGAPLGHMSNSSGHLCQARRKSDGNAETILFDWAGRLSRNNISQRSGGMEMAA